MSKPIINTYQSPRPPLPANPIEKSVKFVDQNQTQLDVTNPFKTHNLKDQNLSSIHQGSNISGIGGGKDDTFSMKGPKIPQDKLKKIDDAFTLQDQKSSRRASPKKILDVDQVPTREKELPKREGKDSNMIFASDESNRLYHEHMRRKEEIRANIEAKVREKAFLEQIEPKDMAYMLQKQKEHEIKEHIEEFDERFPNRFTTKPKKVTFNQDDQDSLELSKTMEKVNLTFQKTQKSIMYTDEDEAFEPEELIQIVNEEELEPEEKKRLNKDRNEFNQIIQQVKSKQQNYHSKVEDTEVTSIRDKLVQLRKNNPHLPTTSEYLDSSRQKDKEDLDCLETAHQFNEAYHQFRINEERAERNRQDALNKLTNLQVMEKYLMDERSQQIRSFVEPAEMEFTVGRLHHKAEASQETEAQRQKHLFELERQGRGTVDPKTMQSKYDIDIRDIKCWSDLNGAVEKQRWEESLEKHEEKIDRFRHMKRYQFFLQENEDDMEAERVMSDIKNLYHESRFTFNFTK